MSNFISYTFLQNQSGWREAVSPHDRWLQTILNNVVYYLNEAPDPTQNESDYCLPCEDDKALFFKVVMDCEFWIFRYCCAMIVGQQLGFAHWNAKGRMFLVPTWKNTQWILLIQFSSENHTGGKDLQLDYCKIWTTVIMMRILDSAVHFQMAWRKYWLVFCPCILTEETTFGCALMMVM